MQLSKIKLDTVAVANMATGGVILTTAVASVDQLSYFVITQTTAGQTMTLATPTDTTAGHIVIIGSSTTSTVSFKAYGADLYAGESIMLLWNGTTWSYPDGGRNTGAKIVLATMIVGNNTVTHNLALPTGQFDSVLVEAYDAIGNSISAGILVSASCTTNAIVINSPIARATATTFKISPLI